MRPRVDSDLYDRLVELGLSIEDAIKIAIKVVSGSALVPAANKVHYTPSKPNIDVSGIENRLDTLHSDVDQVETYIDTIETVLGTISAALAAVKVQTDKLTFSGSDLRITAPPGAPVEVDIGSLGGAAIDAVGVLGGLGTGLLCGIGSAAGNMLSVGSNGETKTRIIDGSNNPVAIGYPNTDAVSTSTYALAVIDFRHEYNYYSGFWNRKYHSFYHAWSNVTSNGNTSGFGLHNSPKMNIAITIKIGGVAPGVLGNYNIKYSIDNNDYFNATTAVLYSGAGSGAAEIMTVNNLIARYVCVNLTGWTFGAGSVNILLYTI